MDFTNANTNVLLQSMEREMGSRWTELKEKLKSLEESLQEINAEKEDLKMKLTLSREIINKHEKEKNELASCLEDLHQGFLKSPFITLISKLEQNTSLLKILRDSSQPNFKPFQQSVDKCENVEHHSSHDLVDNFISLKSHDQVLVENGKSVSFSDTSRIQFENTSEGGNSDIELSVSDENDSSNLEEPSVSKTKLVIRLPRIEIMQEQPVVSCKSGGETHFLENRSERSIVTADTSHEPSCQPIPGQQRCLKKICLICRIRNVQSNFFFESYSALNKHIFENHPDCSPIYFQCNLGCRKFYKSKKGMLRHKRSIHSNENFSASKNFPKKKPTRRQKWKICATCDERFLFLNDLRRHEKEIHDIVVIKKVKDFKKIVTSEENSDSTETLKCCIICEEFYFSESDLNAHIKKAHPCEFREVKKLNVDFRKKPKLLPKLRSHIRPRPSDNTTKQNAEVDKTQPKKSLFDYKETVSYAACSSDSIVSSD